MQIIPTFWTIHQNTTLAVTTYGEIIEDCVVIVHGFKGFKDWGFFPYLATKLAENGFASILFNFSGNGVKGHDNHFSDLEGFEQNTFTKEKIELLDVLHLIAHEPLTNRPKRIHLLGHSRGGAIAILAASIAQNLPIASVTTWASISTVDRFNFELWEKQGYLEVPNTRTGQIFRLGKALYDDIQQHKNNELNILNAAAKLKVPLTLIHGEDDEAVPLNESIALSEVQKNSNLIKIPKTGHTFESTHPFQYPSSALEMAIHYTLRNLQKINATL